MIFNEKKLKGVYEIQLEPREDNRGFFMRVYDEKIFQEKGLDRKWVQENHSFSKNKGTIRGLHFQYAPDTETKMLRAITGKVFFAIIDIRKGSPTFGKWDKVILSAKKKNMLFVPRGCTLGMCTLTKNVNLLYKVDNYYAANNEDNIKYDDSTIGIKWPKVINPTISDRDMKAQSFNEWVQKHSGIEV